MRVTGTAGSVGIDVAAAEAAATEPVSGGSGWLDALERTAALARSAASGSAQAPDARISQLSELIKLQMDVCRHQVQVELVSKVAESGVASVRKLQQQQ